MTLRDWIKENSIRGKDLEAFAKCCGTTAGQLKQVAGGHRRPSVGLAVAIDRETHGQVKAETLRADVDWEYLKVKFVA